MTARRVKQIRALDRGLSVLRVLYEVRATTLHELHDRLQLPKATLSRILLTLQSQGFIWQSIGDNLYRASYTLKAMSDYLEPRDKLAEIAGPILDTLCAKVQWPSDLSVRSGHFMQLRETTRAHSYFVLNRLQIGFKVSMLLSAPGRTYLAFCSEEERREILGLLEKQDDPGYPLLRSPSRLDRILRETREQGYGCRDLTWGGHYSLPKTRYNDGLNAIAVPILGRSRILGCVNIVWIKRLFRQDQVAHRHLRDLEKAAASIAKAVDAN